MNVFFISYHQPKKNQISRTFLTRELLTVISGTIIHQNIVFQYNTNLFT